MCVCVCVGPVPEQNVCRTIFNFVQAALCKGPVPEQNVNNPC